MIEVIYKDEKQEMKDGTTEWELPKNIRQIGLVSGDYRIYIEDYVYTFLHRAAQTKGRDEENGSCLAILLGEARWRSGNGVVFIRGRMGKRSAKSILRSRRICGRQFMKNRKNILKDRRSWAGFWHVSRFLWRPRN